ncbi:MAG: hypothetical protein GWO81_01880 [Verrucomicrobia bacterium]|nr:hypothetical protein [Verrucomicrobiota bacterium]
MLLKLRLCLFLLLGSLCLEAKSFSVELPISAPAQGEGLWIALDASSQFGSTVVEVDDERRVFLPFQADLVIESRGGSAPVFKVYRDFKWRTASDPGIDLKHSGGQLMLRFRGSAGWDGVRAVQWFGLTNSGILAPEKKDIARGVGGDVYLPRYYQPSGSGALRVRGALGAWGEKPRLYQLLPRLFGNENERRKINGTLAENGSGKFSDLSEAVLEKLRADQYTHLWLTGILQHATSTDYTAAGQTADDPDLLKGIAGSPYAIRDYFDVSPDLAEDPAARLEEFKALAARMRAAGLKLIIDFVPNHVARSYASDIRPDLVFGNRDRRSKFFLPDNNFFYLTPEVVEGSGPLRLPTIDPQTGRVINETARVVGRADGYFLPERSHGKVTGNNVVSWQPTTGDWYETVKLNYGFNFLQREAPPEYPSAASPRKRIPDTWKKMDAIIAYWQEMGVDGFRVDMAHMVPPEFWKWLIHRARARQAEVFFMAEAYEDDPAKVPSHEPTLRESDGVMVALLDAGFNAVYDDASYDVLMELLEAGAWANDLDRMNTGKGAMFFDRALRYTENHDEVRLAHPRTWGDAGMDVGRPVSATLFGLSRGPVMVYHGQKVGEPALGVEGFGGDDERTSIFDYWSLPELNKWWNEGAADGAGLSPEQTDLRAWYVRLLGLLGERAFTTGNTVLLNEANQDNPFYGKIEDVGPSGHWLHAYLRSDTTADSHYLVASNFHPKADMRHVRIRLPRAAVKSLGIDKGGKGWIVAEERLSGNDAGSVAWPADYVVREGLYLERIGSHSAVYLKLSLVEGQPAGVKVGAMLPAGQAYLGASPLIRLEAGASHSIDLRRYGNPGAFHHFAVGEVDGLNAELDLLNHRLNLRVDGNASGLRVLPLRLVPTRAGENVMESSIPVAIDAVARWTFELKGYYEANSVALVGDFNNWNSGADLLQRTEKGWRLDKAIKEPGIRYKYVVDGNWMSDPENPLREADGHGGFNSLAQDPGATGEEEQLTLYVEQVERAAIKLRANDEIQRAHAEALIEKGGCVSLPVEVNHDTLRVAYKGLVPAGTLVRVIAVGADGKVAWPAIAYAGKPPKDSWRDDIIYYAFTDRFKDGNPTNTVRVGNPEVDVVANYHGGDFEGVLQALEEGYFESLGVNVIWLAPLNQNPAGAWQEYLPPFRSYTGYHGYWPIRRYAVEPRFGGEAALHALVDAAHKKEVKILADLVLKHVHIENPIRMEQPELFGELELSDGSRNLRRWNDNPYTTWFEPFLPAFDFRNPETVDFLLQDAAYWINEYGLDGYRLDAVKHIRPDFWGRFRSHMRDSFPEARHYFVGETFQDREGIAAFVGPNMLDGQFDFPLYDILMECFALDTAGFAKLEVALRESEAVYGRSTRMSPLFGNHDKPRFMAYADRDLPDSDEADEEEVGWSKTLRVDNPAAYEKLKLAMTFLMSIDGVPMLYYGDEIGMTGAGDPDNRRRMRFDGEVTIAELSVRDHFSKLAQARRSNPALYMGSRRTLDATESTYAYVRAHGTNRALVAFNRGDKDAVLELDLDPEIQSGEFREVLSGARIKVQGGRVRLSLKQQSSALYILHNP